MSLVSCRLVFNFEINAKWFSSVIPDWQWCFFKTSEWTCEEVKGWVMSIFNDESIAKRFVEEEITGTTLLSQRILNDNSMERLGLNTIGKKEKFSSSVQKLG